MIECEARLWYTSSTTKKNTKTGGLACSSYTTFSKNSKTNSRSPKKGRNAASGSSMRSSQSSYRSLRRGLPVFSGVSEPFSALTGYDENNSTPSWHPPGSHGNGCGRRFGK